MNFLLFNLFSTIENVASVVLMLVIFKFRASNYIPHILVTSVTMSLLSYSMRFELGTSSWVPFFALITLFLFMWITFRIAIYYALIITVIGFITFGTLQAILIFSLQFFGVISLEMIEIPSLLSYSLQFISSMIAFFIAYLFKRKNYGFNWAPHSRSVKFIWNERNITLLVAVIASMAAIGIVFHLYFSGNIHFLLITVLSLVMIAYLVYLAVKHEGDMIIKRDEN